MQVIKRDGRKVEFESLRIKNAIVAAMADTEKGVDEELAIKITEHIQKTDKDLNVEEIQDMVENKLMASSRKDVARSYITYRNKRTEEREKNSEKERYYREVLECTNIDNDNANVDQYSFSGKKYRIADNEQKLYAIRNLLSKEGREAFESALIYHHDLSSWAIGEHNCLFTDLDRLLENGFETRNGDVRTASNYATACQLVAVIFQCQSQYGFVY